MANKLTKEMLEKAMQDAWIDFVQDTDGCYPNCFFIKRGRLYCEFSKGGNFTGAILNNLITSITANQALSCKACGCENIKDNKCQSYECGWLQDLPYPYPESGMIDDQALSVEEGFRGDISHPKFDEQTLLIRARNEISLLLGNEGCDHSIGMCFCSARYLLDDLDERIKTLTTPTNTPADNNPQPYITDEDGIPVHYGDKGGRADDEKLVETRSMLLCAFRYALGRRTYVTSECHDWLLKYWDIMTPYHKQIHDDIRHAIEHDIAGDKCDIESWRRILALPLKCEVK